MAETEACARRSIGVAGERARSEWGGRRREQKWTERRIWRWKRRWSAASGPRQDRLRRAIRGRGPGSHSGQALRDGSGGKHRPRGRIFHAAWTRMRGLRRKSGPPWELRKYGHSGALEDEGKGR